MNSSNNDSSEMPKLPSRAEFFDPHGFRRFKERLERTLARKPEDFYSASARRRLPEVQRQAREALDKLMGKK